MLTKESVDNLLWYKVVLVILKVLRGDFLAVFLTSFSEAGNCKVRCRKKKQAFYCKLAITAVKSHRLLNEEKH